MVYISSSARPARRGKFLEVLSMMAQKLRRRGRREYLHYNRLFLSRMLICAARLSLDRKYDRLQAPNVLFTPQIPCHAYPIWKLVALNRLPLNKGRGESADIVIRFEDTTYSSYDLSITARRHDLNARCRDISKDHVGCVFAAVFGYDLSIDPTTFFGPAVAKSKVNATHDGRIIQCPIDDADPATEYQKVVRNYRAQHIVDLRTVVVGRQIPVVYEKLRPTDTRFLSANSHVRIRNADELFSVPEQTLILSFCNIIGLDIGELDVLRDTVDGRLYIVDVNKTAYSHPIELKFRDALAALLKMTAAFREEYVETAAGRAPQQMLLPMVHVSAANADSGDWTLVEVA